MASITSWTTLFMRRPRQCAVGHRAYSLIRALENHFDFCQIVYALSFERSQNNAKPFDESLQFLRQETGGFEDITPHMERTRRQPCYGLQARPREIVVFGRMLSQKRGENLRKMTDFGHKPIVVPGADHARPSADRLDQLFEFGYRVLRCR